MEVLSPRQISSLITTAVAMDDLPSVRRLLTWGNADLNALDDEGCHVLKAVLKSYGASKFPLVQLLIENGADGKHMLTAAMKCSNNPSAILPLVTLLLDNGAKPTPSLLLEIFAGTAIKCPGKIWVHPSTAIDAIAFEKLRLDVITLFLKHGAKVDFASKTEMRLMGFKRTKSSGQACPFDELVSLDGVFIPKGSKVADAACQLAKHYLIHNVYGGCADMYLQFLESLGDSVPTAEAVTKAAAHAAPATSSGAAPPLAPAIMRSSYISQRLSVKEEDQQLLLQLFKDKFPVDRHGARHKQLANPEMCRSGDAVESDGALGGEDENDEEDKSEKKRKRKEKERERKRARKEAKARAGHLQCSSSLSSFSSPLTTLTMKKRKWPQSTEAPGNSSSSRNAGNTVNTIYGRILPQGLELLLLGSDEYSLKDLSKLAQVGGFVLLLQWLKDCLRLSKTAEPRRLQPFWAQHLAKILELLHSIPIMHSDLKRAVATGGNIITLNDEAQQQEEGTVLKQYTKHLEKEVAQVAKREAAFARGSPVLPSSLQCVLPRLAKQISHRWKALEAADALATRGRAALNSAEHLRGHRE
jgi:hypothetical protein